MFNMWVSCIMWMWRITRGYNVDLCSLARTHGARRRSVPLLSTSTAETKLMFLGQRTEAALRFFHPLFLLFPEKLSWPEASRRAKPRLGQGLSPSPHTLSLFSRVPRPYLSYRSAKAARSPVIQQQNAFFWRQIRTGPSIRHGLKVRGDGSNMNSAGGGARWREFSDPRRSAGFFFGGPRCDSSPCSSSSSLWTLEVEKFSSSGWSLCFGSAWKRPRALNTSSVREPVGETSPSSRSLVSTAASSTHASLKPVSSCSANHGSGGVGRQTRNVPAPQLNTAPGEEEGEEEEEGGWRRRRRRRRGGVTHIDCALTSFTIDEERKKKRERKKKWVTSSFLHCADSPVCDFRWVHL